MNFEACAQLLRILEKIEEHDLPLTLDNWCEKRFHRIGPWWRRQWNESRAFCVMGWAAQDPWFIEHGFRLESEVGEIPVVAFASKIEWDAVTAFLDIAESEAVFLLDGGHYGREITPVEIGLRLLAFMRSKQPAEIHSCLSTPE